MSKVKPFQPEYYTDDAGEVRWRVFGANGEIIDASSEGFANLHKAWDNYNLGLQGQQTPLNEVQLKENANAHTADDSGAAEGSELKFLGYAAEEESPDEG